MTEPLDWIERYEIRSVREPKGWAYEGWAIIHIDSKGFLGIVSDYGNYAYHWSSFGDDFKAFLAQLDWDYLYHKITHQQRVYDGQATLLSIQSELKKWLMEGDLSDEQFQEERELLERLDLDSVCGFGDWLRETQLTEAYHLDLAEYRNDQQCEIFCKMVWPKFVAILKEGRSVALKVQT